MQTPRNNVEPHREPFKRTVVFGGPFASSVGILREDDMVQLVRAYIPKLNAETPEPPNA